MGPFQAIKTCLAKSFQFSGRASRAEFWWFAPAWTSFLLVTLVRENDSYLSGVILTMPLTTAAFLILVAFMLPVFAVMSRRLRDCGIPSTIMWSLLAYLVIVPPVVVIVDQSTSFGFFSQNRMLPEAAFAVIGYLGLIAFGFLACLRPTHTRDTIPNPHEVPQ